MLKSLAVLAVFTSLFQVYAPAPGHPEVKNAESSGKPEDSGYSHKAPATKAMVVDPKTDPSPSNKNADNQDTSNNNVTVFTTEPLKVQADVPKDWRDKLNWVLSAILVVVSIFGVCLGFMTLRTPREAAEAALLNAKAVINAERPWIEVKIERVDVWTFLHHRQECR